MSTSDAPATADRLVRDRYLPLLLLLFVGSGCSALIYEIVWFQLLQLVVGSSAVSLAVLLGTFMGGMCAGSLALPRLVSARRHPLRIYALLEVGIGLAGLVLLYGLPHLSGLYIANSGAGSAELLVRGLVAFVCLLPPTVLMGATLPAVARGVESDARGLSWLGFFYGGNILGAVFGSLLAGFYLLRVYDMATATYVAAAVNACVALLGVGIALVRPHEARPAVAAGSAEPAGGAWPVYVAIGISGATALAAEVVWTRLLALTLGATVYTFSIILAVFLVGLGIGSTTGSALARASRRPRILFAVCQILLAGAIGWSALVILKSLPYWPINPYLSRSPWYQFQLDLVRCAWALLPATCLWGASFPLALAAAARPGQETAELVGGVYAANTVGAIFGAMLSGLVLIPSIGTHGSQQVLIGASAVAAILALVPSLRGLFARRLTANASHVLLRLGGAFCATTALTAAAVLLVRGVPETPWQLVAYGRSLLSIDYTADCLFLGEGRNSSIAVTQLTNGVRNFHVSGKVEASSEPQDMRLQRMLGHLPALFHPKPRSALIVGFGAGVTSGTFLVHPEFEKVVICEIEPLIPERVGPLFTQQNHDVNHDPRVTIHFDDARHFVLTSDEKFDIITSDPIHPWVKGSATLYTKEYFEMCKRHLNPGGVITQWVPLYESNFEVVRSEIATFFEVFPNGTVWGNDQNGDGYDVVLLGQADELKLDADALEERLRQPDHAAVAKSLHDVGFPSAVSLLSTYAGRAAALKPWLEGAEVNLDRNLRLQYLAGMGLNDDLGKQIYDLMLQFRDFPEDLFTGSGLRSRALRLALARSHAEDREDSPE